MGGAKVTKSIFSVTRPDVVVLADFSHAAEVIASGKTPITIDVWGVGTKGVFDPTNGSVSHVAPLGLGTTNNFYGLTYVVRKGNADGTSTVLKDGNQVIDDKAPVLSPLSAENKYVVGKTDNMIGFSVVDANDTATLTVERQPTNGSLRVLGDRIIYTPKSGYVGMDEFSVRATDAFGAYDLSSAVVTVVNEFTGAPKITVTPTTISGGLSAARMTFSTGRDDIVFIGNASQAASVIASGKVPVMIDASVNDSGKLVGTIDTTGVFTAVYPLGISASGGYNIKYSVSQVNDVGVLTLLKTGVASSCLKYCIMWHFMA